MNNRPTNEDKKYFEKVVRLGCLICGSPAEIHHLFTKTGCKKDHSKVAPLCPIHHRNGGYGIAIHRGKKEFAKNYFTEQELLEKVSRLVDV